MRILKEFILILSIIIIICSVFFYFWRMDVGVYFAFVILLFLLWRNRASLNHFITELHRIMRKTTQENVIFKLFLKNATPNLIQGPDRSGCRNKFGMTFEGNKKRIFEWVSFAVFTASILLIVYYLLRHRTDLPIRSPWEVVSWKLFVLYGIAGASLFLFLLSKVPKWLKWLFIFSFSFISFGTALILYKIGYGFDPFIHRATVKHIAEFGTITPKPFYYIGQYALVLFFHKIFFLPIAWIDKILVPLLASLTLPTLFYLWSKKLSSDIWNLEFGIWNFIVALCATLLPFSAFIVTTPQSLANLLLLILIFFTITPDTDWELGIGNWKFIIALAIMLIHPLSGIPAFLFLLLTAILNKIKGVKKYIGLIFTTIIGSVIMPIIFIVRNKESFQITLNNILPTFRLFIENKLDLFRNLAYLYRFNFWLIFLGLAVIGLIILIYKKQSRLAFSCAISSLIVFLNAIFLKIFIKFPEVISYEQSDYSVRLINIASLFLYPLVLIPTIYFFKKVTEGNLMVKLFAVIFITYLSVSSFYISYPRVDKYESTHGFSTSKFDVDAVKFIEEKTDGKKYIVLANQAVSAAALQEFGFKNRYYKTQQLPLEALKNPPTEIYFYPIPTGGILYQYYLKMVYETPSKLTATKAAQLVGAEEVYLVVNSYWYNAKNIVRAAKETADEWWKLDDGRIYIFKYLPTNLESKTTAKK